HFATAGLETGLTFTWLGGCFWLLVRLNADVPRAVSATGWRRALPRATPTLAAVAIGLGVLVRPDLGIFSVGFMIALLLSPVRERRLSRLRLVGWAVLAPVVYEVFRMGYFAALEPNTALAKEAGIADWSRGWTYLTDFLDPYKL